MRWPTPDWTEWYSPLMGASLEDIAFMPIRADTPDVVSALDSPLIAQRPIYESAKEVSAY